VFVGAVDAVGGVSCGSVGLKFWGGWAYACARKTMPTRLRRLTRKAMFGDVVLLGRSGLGAIEIAVMPIGDVGLPEKLGGRFPRGMPVSHAIS
jgi:hypothetical protein